MIVIFITYQKIHYRNAEIERDFLFFSTLPFHLDFSPSKINQSFLFMLLDTTTKQGSPFSKMSKVQQTSIDNVDMLPKGVFFFQKVRCVFQISKSPKKIFQKAILSLKFKFPAKNSKQQIQISSSGQFFGIFCFGDLEI